MAALLLLLVLSCLAGGLEARPGSLDKLNHPECGITPGFGSAKSEVSLFVTNGDDAEEGQFPWVVSLRYRRLGKPFSRGEHKCGGTLIGERIVVTAAHCIKVAKYELSSVVVGQIDISEIGENNEKVIESKRVHEEYKEDKGAAVNDIAILILKKPVRFNQYVQPACVFFRDSDQLDNPGKDGFEVAGWGRTETGKTTNYLQWLAFTRIPPDTCQRTRRENRPDFLLPESQLCATGDEGSACNGDSGGPMVTRMGLKWYLAGIVSFGTSTCDSSAPGFYTRVASFYGWMEKNIRTTADQSQEGTWSSWASFGPCSKTCGEGFWTRKRTCDGEMCKGDNFEVKACSVEACGGSGCDDDQFKCRSGQCIQADLFPSDLKCDGYNDCDDKSDEHRCPVATTRRPTNRRTTTRRPTAPACDDDQFKCRSGQCIQADYKCDGYEDCNDKSDEHRCRTTTTTRPPNRRPTAPATGGDCTYSCTAIGGCQVKYDGAPRPGPSSGACFPQSFGGKCTGTPPECSDCNTVEQCEKKK